MIITPHLVKVNPMSPKIAVSCLDHMMVHHTLPIIIAKLLQLMIKMVSKNDVDFELVSNGAKHYHTHVPEF